MQFPDEEVPYRTAAQTRLWWWMGSGLLERVGRHLFLYAIIIGFVGWCPGVVS